MSIHRAAKLGYATNINCYRWYRYPRFSAFRQLIRSGENTMQQAAKTAAVIAANDRLNSQYEVEFDASTGTLWGYFNPNGNPCFSLGLQADIRAHDSAL